MNYSIHNLKELGAASLSFVIIAVIVFALMQKQPPEVFHEKSCKKIAQYSQKTPVLKSVSIKAAFMASCLQLY